MPTKEEMANTINDKLGTDIEWERMKSDDLEHLLMLIEEGLLLEPLARQVAKDKGSELVEEKIDNWELGTLAKHLL